MINNRHLLNFGFLLLLLTVQPLQGNPDKAEQALARAESLTKTLKTTTDPAQKRKLIAEIRRLIESVSPTYSSDPIPGRSSDLSQLWVAAHYPRVRDVMVNVYHTEKSLNCAPLKKLGQ